MKHGENKLSGASLFAAGFCQGWITAFANSESVSATLLTDRVVDILLSTREGNYAPVPEVRSPAASHVQHVSEVAVAKRTHRNVQRKVNRKAKTRSTADGVKAYWRRMTPKQRREEILRRAEVRRKNKEQKEKQAA